ncbi:uncharacterized protein LOC110816281 [Carica papaya]|uniref:uncharacterized protein LOC110816281 n=1 Tax=Carica papaya TaxID=3649 RepID=UPI000B8CC05F|nr:uncharacterized protein LOC110816281 [Carica papaya]
MSHIFRDKPKEDSKRHNQSNRAMTVYPDESLPSPLGNPAPALSDSELRETAYEILVAACRSSGARPLTYISQSEMSQRNPGQPVAAVAPPSLQRSLTSTATSKVKKALGMKSGKRRDSESVSQGGRVKRAVTAGELVRVQMRVSEQTDSRIRRALLRIAAGQLGRRIESIILPLELLHQLKPSDFPSHQEYEAWQRRNLKLLEAGLLLYPHLPLDKNNTAARQLRQIIQDALETPSDTGRSFEALRSAVMPLACRTFDGSVSDIRHWADGIPLNLRLYQVLLEACFDVNDEWDVIEEVDEILELIKKTWIILGLNQMLHNVCFLWILFQRYVSTGQVETDLLFAANNLLLEVEKDAKETKNPSYSKILSSVLSSILGWSEKRLVLYHDTFHSDNVDLMESIVSLNVSTAKILVEDISHEYQKKRKEVDETSACDRVDSYIRSSLRAAFAQILKKVDSSKRSDKNQRSHPLLSILAENTGQLAFNEKAMFSPILKRWLPHAAGVAVATLHSSSSLQVWNPRANRERFAPSAVEVLRIVDETVEAFFLLPIPMHPGLLPELMSALDGCLQHYVVKAKSGCGSRSTFVPALPALTRCSTGSKFHGVFKKKEKLHIAQRSKPQIGSTNGDPFGIPQLCCRINTLQHVHTELEIIGKRPINHLINSESSHADNNANGIGKTFELSTSSCREGIKQLCEATAYRIIFRDLSHVLWDGLYIGEVSSSRIEPFLQELEHYLEIISSTVHDRIRTRVITDLMKASFDGFLLVLLAGGPSHAFTRQDSKMIEEDFKFLTELFWSNGDGLPADIIEKYSVVVKGVLPLFRTDTESLIERFRAATLESYTSAAKSRPPLPPTSGQWSPTEANTLLRVLCYRSDEMAAKFLKKTYNLPKKL